MILGFAIRPAPLALKNASEKGKGNWQPQSRAESELRRWLFIVGVSVR